MELKQKCIEAYDRIIGPVRVAARKLGYAVAVHGSLSRDIDLIAVPWTAEAASAREVAEAIMSAIKEVNNDIAIQAWAPGKGKEFTLDGCPGVKPHGRLGWCWHLGGGPYVDLSVMPRIVGSDNTGA